MVKFLCQNIIAKIHFILFIFARFIKYFIFSINISLKISLWRFGNPTLMNDNCLFKIDLKILFSLIEKSLIFNSSLFENLIKTFLQVLFSMKNNDLLSWYYICNKQQIINFNNCFYLQKDLAQLKTYYLAYLRHFLDIYDLLIIFNKTKSLKTWK